MHVVVLVVLSACAYEVPGEAPLTEMYPAEIEAALEEFSRDHDVSRCDPSKLRVVIADESVLKDLCGDSSSETTGCNSTVPRPERRVIVVDAADMAEERNIVTHELMHWLEECSSGDQDFDHADESVWGEGGVLERANEELGLPGRW